MLNPQSQRYFRENQEFRYQRVKNIKEYVVIKSQEDINTKRNNLQYLYKLYKVR